MFPPKGGQPNSISLEGAAERGLGCSRNLASIQKGYSLPRCDSASGFPPRGPAFLIHTAAHSATLLLCLWLRSHSSLSNFASPVPSVGKQCLMMFCHFISHHLREAQQYADYVLSIFIWSPRLIWCLLVDSDLIPFPLGMDIGNMLFGFGVSSFIIAQYLLS